MVVAPVGQENRQQSPWTVFFQLMHMTEELPKVVHERFSGNMVRTSCYVRTCLLYQELLVHVQPHWRFDNNI